MNDKIPSQTEVESFGFSPYGTSVFLNLSFRPQRVVLILAHEKQPTLNTQARAPRPLQAVWPKISGRYARL
jgi:hypothetical protein